MVSALWLSDGRPREIGYLRAKDIVLRQSIEVHVPECSRGAELFLSRYQPIHARYSIQSRHCGTLSTDHLPCILPTSQCVHNQLRRHVCLILSPTAGIWTVPKQHTVWFNSLRRHGARRLSVVEAGVAVAGVSLLLDTVWELIRF